MDPNATLGRYWTAVEDGDLGEAVDAKLDLITWIERGGFEPDWAASGHSYEEFLASTLSAMARNRA